MSEVEFREAIDSDPLLIKYDLTTDTAPLTQVEIELINLASDNHGKTYGGRFAPGRRIEDFNGSTLLVGGGKTTGEFGDNDGKTILFDLAAEVGPIQTLIDKLNSGEWASDPYTGKTFGSEGQRRRYIEYLIYKKRLYESAFNSLNDDILSRYYVLNILPDIMPDFLASISSEEDMRNISDNKFSRVEFENVPCDVFLDPSLYPILERITKPGGKINFSISYVCRRLIIPVIKQTKFSEQFITSLEEKLYKASDNMDPEYGSCEIEVENI